MLATGNLREAGQVCVRHKAGSNKRIQPCSAWLITETVLSIPRSAAGYNAFHEPSAVLLWPGKYSVRHCIELDDVLERARRKPGWSSATDKVTYRSISKPNRGVYKVQDRRSQPKRSAHRHLVCLQLLAVLSLDDISSYFEVVEDW